MIHNSQQYTGIYICPDSIKNFKIRVKIREIDNGPNAKENINARKKKWDCKEFSWQEKCFNHFERDFFKEEENCISDLDKSYHNLVVNSVESESKLFTYVDQDGFSTQRFSENSLCSLMERINLNKEADLDEVLDESKEYDFQNYLLNNLEKPVIYNKMKFMYIMVDFGEYVDETWVKFEHPLCQLKFIKEKNTLLVLPDFNKNEPYIFEITDQNAKKTYEYFLENVSEKIPEVFELKESEIFKKINSHKRILKNQNIENVFDMPLKNKLNIHLFIEIQSGKCFEYDNICVQYFVDLSSPNWNCKNPENLRGVTQCSVVKNEENLAHFGHHFELILEFDIQELNKKNYLKPVYIYFEIFSHDSWMRFRTEGLTFINLPLHRPGAYQKTLQCFRFTSASQANELRRFFIGDCGNYNDLTWIGVPKNHESKVINKFGVNTISTGQLNVKFDVIHQSQAFISKYNDNVFQNKEKFIFEKLNSSTLVKSVEQVLAAFKEARKNMMEARKNL